jgi:heme/copper-type cytochrome/quinol oxidase subunit 2
VIIAAMFVISMIVLADVNEQSDNTPLTVRVTGYQWQWQFEYLTGPQDDLQPLGVTVLPDGRSPPRWSCRWASGSTSTWRRWT